MTTATPKVTETLAEHTLAFPGNDIPADAREAARKLLLDLPSRRCGRTTVRRLHGNRPCRHP